MRRKLRLDLQRVCAPSSEGESDKVAAQSACRRIQRFIFRSRRVDIPHTIQSEFPARIVEVDTAISGCDSDRRAASDIAPLRRANGIQTQLHRKRAPQKERGRQRGGPVLVTENLMSLSRRGSIIAALFPKEQVPASTPIPPARSGPSFFSAIVAIPWAQLQSPLRLSRAVAKGRRCGKGRVRSGICVALGSSHITR
jgi:hypothetical protein